MGHYVDGNNLMLPNGGRMKREDRHERGSAGPEPMVRAFSISILDLNQYWA